MATINLAPGSRYLVAARLRRQRLLLLAAGLALVLVGIWAGLYFIQWRLAKTQGVLSNQLAAINAQIEQLQPEARRIELFERRLQALDSLLSTHLDWGPLVADVEKWLVPAVVLRQVEMDSAAGLLTINGYANDMDQVAQAVAALTSSAGHSTLFSRADLSHIQEEIVKTPNAEEVRRYNFSLSLTFDPAKLRRQPL